MTRKLALIFAFVLVWTITSGSAPGETAPEASESLRKAAKLFQSAREELSANPRSEPSGFGLAATFFQQAVAKGAKLTAEQQAAWYYCRLRVAADRLNRANSDAAIASEVLAEAIELQQLTANLENLKPLSTALVQAATQRGGKASQAQLPTAEPTLKVIGRADGWEVIETESFRVRHTNHRSIAEQVARAAELARAKVFQTWSGPAGGEWKTKCEILLHPDAASFSQTTKQPDAATGHAWVKLEDGKVTERRIDLRADDLQLLSDALPREITYIVLADLFWDKAPPKWAELGMAVLACSPTEVSRYRRSLGRCAQAGELSSVEALLEAKEIPSDQLTGFYVGSVNLVDFLVKWKGAKTFTSFLRDAQRYGQLSALQRHYGIRDPKQLQQLWLQGELTR